MTGACRTDHFSFNVPADWFSRTVISWSAPPDATNPVTPNILIAYDRPRVDEDLAAYTTRQLKEVAATAQDFHLELRRDIALTGRPAVEVLFHWNSGGSVNKQRQVFSLLPDGQVILIATLAARDKFADVDPQFLSILRSWIWTDDGATAM